MPRTTPAFRIDLDRARAHWHARQGLAEPANGALAEVIARTGWPRTLGGVDVYLAVRARVPGLRRADLDEAVERSEVQVIPAVRGCIYLVPRAEVPLALRIAEELSRKRSDRDLEKVDVSQREIAGVGEAALSALEKGPLTTDALRRALPAGVVRSLGDKGKKIGLSSTLPPALRHLEFEGRVERTLEGGRLDTERYAWRLTKESPFAGASLPDNPIDRHAALARAFFGQAGPATAKDFAAWTGLSQRDAAAAIQRAPLAPIAVDGHADEAFALEEDLLVLGAPAGPAGSIAMLSFEDNFVTLHGGPALITDARHHGRKIPVWGHTRGTTLGDAKHISMRALLIGDRLAGLWEYDPDAGAVIFGTFDKLPAAQRGAVQEKAEDLGRFLRDDLGHAKSFSLDTVDALRERAALVKAI